ncbi:MULTISPECIES: nitrate- and nitrite sensing domain-containing protein [unclassified Micromonospora]|uniref:sensor histidine kinase n=1 Tax=unclassified Micromonospora TaxID=2617518 RepID=UPI001C2186E4|nr:MULTISPECIES: nitrate- and nitrite sensing domain-containing protein [unclassified Micromonospora]MBU8857370.1 nitrate- and nitrite sensing domain-containing protein [Micromonospora sp. WMMB482]MDM4782994.1 nitrate- and nitrite sensing domain-containing protein [Micromonospora sp. b486]
MLLGRLRIRGKLALLVIIPLLSMVGLAVPVVIDRVTAAREAADTAETVRVASRVGSLVQDLQQERLLSVGLLLGRVSRTELIQKSATVDDRVADLRAEPLPTAVRDSLDVVRRLEDVRNATLAGRATPQQILTMFGEVDTALIDALRLPFQVNTDTAAGRQVLALDALLRVDEALSSCTTQIVLVKATGDPQVARSFVACMAALSVDNRRFRKLITPEQLKVAELDDAAVAARTSPTFLVDSLRDPDGAIAPVPLDVLFPSARSMITLGQFVEKKVVADVIAETRAREREALTAAWLVSLAAATILLVVVLLSMTVARTVARPLSRLTRSAERVARVTEAELTRVADDESETVPPVRLDPVEVSARDEIGDLARAFDRVQHTAARLVERQVAGRRNVAQMFGHVGRRTQNLVGRQIALIDRLERQETDPGRLEHLYRLDHISSRLRRNAGSLVVLSGATGSDGHVAPVPLADVVRLALGEIEDYTRVDVEVPPGVAAAPAIAGDLVLTLAELMENATSFSPPHTRVVVTGELTDGGARLVVVDHGIGLTEDRMTEENARFTRRERLDLAPTEVLGLFVVGRLARRHGWSVRLSHTPGSGVTAVLEIPGASLVIRRPEPVGAGAGRATVPTAREPEPPAVDAPAGFDAELLTRATRSMSSGDPWNAFGSRSGTGEADEDAAPATGGPPPGTRPPGPAARPGHLSPPTPVVGPAPAAPPAAGPATGPTLAPPSTRSAPAPSTRSALAPTTGPALAPPPAGARPPAPAGPPPAVPNPAGRPGTRSPIRQRVPGANLPAAPPAGPAGPATGGPLIGVPTDPSSVRALVEAFQDGVRRAEGDADQAPPVAERPRLSRRVPGANLSVSPAQSAPPTSSDPGDPVEVRNRISEFEAGVARALREVSTDRRYEEDPSR